MGRKGRDQQFRRLLLGEVHVVSRTGHVVVRLADPNVRVRLGLKVVDGNGREIGKLADIIGNVEAPYAVIKPSTGDLPGEGEKVFVLVPTRRGKRRGGRRRGKRIGKPDKRKVPRGAKRSRESKRARRAR